MYHECKITAYIAGSIALCIVTLILSLTLITISKIYLNEGVIQLTPIFTRAGLSKESYSQLLETQLENNRIILEYKILELDYLNKALNEEQKLELTVPKHKKIDYANK